MTTYVKGQVAIVKTRFKASDGSATQPDAVTVYFAFTNTSGVASQSDIAATYNTTSGRWEAAWRTILAQDNTEVSWWAHSTSGLEGADEGSFFVKAGPAVQ